MNNAERLAFATAALDEMLRSLRADIADGATEFTPDHFAHMAQTLKSHAEPEWIDMLMWVLAIAEHRLATQAVST